jgi:hypothetical protein
LETLHLRLRAPQFYPTAMYQIGDRIQQAWLVEIQPTCVLLDRGGQEEALCFSKNELVETTRQHRTAYNRPRRGHQTTRTRVRCRMTGGSDIPAMLPQLSQPPSAHSSYFPGEWFYPSPSTAHVPPQYEPRGAAPALTPRCSEGCGRPALDWDARCAALSQAFMGHHEGVEADHEPEPPRWRARLQDRQWMRRYREAISPRSVPYHRAIPAIWIVVPNCRMHHCCQKGGDRQRPPTC